MNAWCFALPAAPGKTDLGAKELPDHVRVHFEEYERSRRSAGVVRERVYLMRTPHGDIFTVYVEGIRDFAAINRTFGTSQLTIDKELLEAQEEMTGMPLRSMRGVEPELVWNYLEEFTPRSKALAFSIPLSPGRAGELKDFFAEAGARKHELQASRRAHGVTRDQAWMLEGESGDVACVYIESHNPMGANETFAYSSMPYDVWFRERVSAITGLNLNEPLPPIEEIWDWSA